jgi:L-fuconolactonase
MVTEADHAAWQLGDITPFVDVVRAAFDEDRLMYGSDWPVCLLAGSYQRVFELAEYATRGTGATAREKFLGGNAARVYGLQ